MALKADCTNNNSCRTFLFQSTFAGGNHKVNQRACVGGKKTCCKHACIDFVGVEYRVLMQDDERDSTRRELERVRLGLLKALSQLPVTLRCLEYTPWLICFLTIPLLVFILDQR
jgi:hypothetical protein